MDTKPRSSPPSRTQPGSRLLQQIRTHFQPSELLPPVALVAAHPDDEVIGAGILLSHLNSPAIVHTTDGAPRDLRDAKSAGFSTRKDYAAARRRELLCALGRLNIPRDRAYALGFVDQEAVSTLSEMAQRLTGLLHRIRPEVVLTHPYEGGHPDHDATAFAVHAAASLLRRDYGAGPDIIEFTSYHNHFGRMSTFEFLPCEDAAIETLVLTKSEKQLKNRLVACFETQLRILRQFPIELERFRPAPRYAFTEPPHPGALLYECFNWGISAGRWCSLAAAALDELGLSGAI